MRCKDLWLTEARPWCLPLGQIEARCDRPSGAEHRADSRERVESVWVFDNSVVIRVASKTRLGVACNIKTVFANSTRALEREQDRYSARARFPGVG
jgi:hypothetical protein